MTTFQKLIEAQDDTCKFSFTPKGTNHEWNMRIRTAALWVMVYKDDHMIGEIHKDGYITKESSILQGKQLRYFLAETNKEDSIIAPIWKQAIIKQSEEYLKREQDRHNSIIDQLRDI